MSSAQSRSWLAKKSNSWISPDWKGRERERDATNEHAHLCSHPHIQIHNLSISHPLESLHKSHCSPTHKMVRTLHHPFVVVYTSSVISPAAASHSTINRALTKHQHTHSTQGTQGTTKLINSPYCPGNLQPFHTEGGDMVHFHQWPSILYPVFIPGSRYAHYFVEGFLAIVCNVVLWNCH